MQALIATTAFTQFCRVPLLVGGQSSVAELRLFAERLNDLGRGVL
jgi:hypothetical protein